MNYEDILARLRHHIYQDDPLPVEFAEELLDWLKRRSHELRKRPEHKQSKKPFRVAILSEFYRLSSNLSETEAHEIIVKMYGNRAEHINNWLGQGRYADERKEAKKRAAHPTVWTPL